MENKIKLSDSDLYKLISCDEEFKNLYYTSASFNKIIKLLTWGLNTDDVIDIIKTLCTANEDLTQRLVKTEQTKCVYYK